MIEGLCAHMMLAVLDMEEHQGEERHCPACGKPFTVIPGAHRGRLATYCSRRCRNRLTVQRWRQRKETT
jgi:endogenous inhibitor of DNA gyrase (YacG/DUF329 family)